MQAWRVVAFGLDVMSGRRVLGSNKRTNRGQRGWCEQGRGAASANDQLKTRRRPPTVLRFEAQRSYPDSSPSRDDMEFGR